MSDEITLDNWKPSPKKEGSIRSKWRSEQYKGKKYVQPGYSEVRRIRCLLSKGVSDRQVCEAYMLSGRTLSAIKRGEYVGYKYPHKEQCIEED